MGYDLGQQSRPPITRLSNRGRQFSRHPRAGRSWHSAAWVTVPLFALAVLLMAWGMEPKRTEAFAGRLPFGNYLLKALAKLDVILPGRS